MLPWSLSCCMLPADDSNGQTETKYHPLAERCTPAKIENSVGTRNRVVPKLNIWQVPERRVQKGGENFTNIFSIIFVNHANLSNFQTRW